MYFQIKELKIQEEGETGIQAISFVDKPAIETDFEYFAVGKRLPFFKYVLQPKFRNEPLVYVNNPDHKSHPFCITHAGHVYHESEIKSWSNGGDGWIDNENFFTTFDAEKGGFSSYTGSYNFNCNSQLYECRHMLERVVRKSEVPIEKRGLAPDVEFIEQHFVKMEMLSEPKREVQGLVLKSNQMIYRNDVDGSGNPGYVYFSRDTVRKLKEKYGYNRSISYMHHQDLTGQAILLDSWLEETATETQWFLKYKIIGDKLWEQIKNQVVKGFSVEALFSIQ